ncbi:ADP-forming succinate--CoA ligase subunit beta [Desulfovibrio legallii]|jgi:succinyl-CoA synthetase beta subunit|uniref:Succinate--CoA ligase [ADP-forming] subunit beta n=1 Tax=Desulfovibrio legallii TaxID=571438 RepID=A0A1G7PGU1_9BACT|nr:ADP-forming succinate--CoA ligase subunit beta [Desulfovibrio legallii]SDF38657.1 succinyl-CoA synthetase (ADP-forming) beta subunit [Desulfovibrio legallii]SDF44677.1 succinyl-CoA synthetase beta subunit [Desulfovibrio legallii]SDF85437.1 succinyl-CoA synthetase beta subunit [Desulfovibrio legallii]SDF93030.1 succinyl-CoA synthetase beta subunit [Desulfovibrio legallii]
MNIHEYQAKGLLGQFGVPVPAGALAATAAEARAAAAGLPGPVWVVKAQIHAGGRGKGGGVQVCKNLDAVEAAAGHIIGMQLITHQTGPEGKKVHKVWVEQGTEIARELYLAVVLDRGAQRLTVMASPDGGMDIEDVAARTPERIFTTRLDGGHHIWPYQARQLFFGCGLTPEQVGKGAALVQNLVRLAVEKDAVLVEINPLAVTTAGDIVALDAKMDFDESALKRHPDVAAMDDPEEGDPLERKARELGVNYVRLSGYVGTMVNGAGLAMATMDAIKQAGAAPANFLDAGGGANEQMVAAGFEVMLSDPHVRGILINIFGGILRCDIVAQGVVNAARKVDLRLPLVVRLEGTNVEEGRRILRESGLNFETAASMSEAAHKIAALTAGGAA